MRSSLPVLLAYAVLSCSAGLTQQQKPDSDFRPFVERPAFTARHPVMVIDEAHRNDHTADGRYAPFAALMRADGFEVRPGREGFTAKSLEGVAVLVIANASAPATGVENPASAFEPGECDAVRDWVRQGGALWLIADHRPHGAAAAALAERFGVILGNGHAYDEDPKHFAGGRPSVLVYSRENGLLAEHAVTRGVDRVIAFTGESVSVPQGAIPLLRFSSTAFEYFTGEQARKLMDEKGQLRPDARAHRGSPIHGKAQGVILEFGQGRVAVFGEAAMFYLGMDIPENGNRRLALNVAEWLARAPQ